MPDTKQRPPEAGGMNYCKLCRKNKPLDDFNIVQAATLNKPVVCMTCWDKYEYAKKSEGTP